VALGLENGSLAIEETDGDRLFGAILQAILRKDVC